MKLSFSSHLKHRGLTFCTLGELGFQSVSLLAHLGSSSFLASPHATHFILARPDFAVVSPHVKRRSLRKSQVGTGPQPYFGVVCRTLPRYPSAGLQLLVPRTRSLATPTITKFSGRFRLLPRITICKNPSLPATLGSSASAERACLSILHTRRDLDLSAARKGPICGCSGCGGTREVCRFFSRDKIKIKYACGLTRAPIHSNIDLHGVGTRRGRSRHMNGQKLKSM
ncbi:hypothetical protein C8R43DRAFT_1024282 [Mycena crocata]|nr:hypothetical protein C8R43DRAFT_1024282 [Mycena crocata]